MLLLPLRKIRLELVYFNEVKHTRIDKYIITS